MLQRRKAMTESAQPFAAKKFLEINGRSMAYIDEGDGAPIVFAHGNPTSSYLWRNVMPACRGLGRLIACDMIGMAIPRNFPTLAPTGTPTPSSAVFCSRFGKSWGSKRML